MGAPTLPTQPNITMQLRCLSLRQLFDNSDAAKVFATWAFAMIVMVTILQIGGVFTTMKWCSDIIVGDIGLE